MFDALERLPSKVDRLKNLSGKVLHRTRFTRGMSYYFEADVDSYEEKHAKRLTSSQITALINEDIEILNERIDQFSVTEPDIRLQGSSQILIEIPECC